MDNMFGINYKESFNQMLENNEKLIKGLDTLMNVDYSGYNSTPKDLVFQQDKMKLYHYKPMKKRLNKTPLLIVYALINKQYMMDLQPDRSMIVKLLEGGQDVYHRLGIPNS